MLLLSCTFFFPQRTKKLLAYAMGAGENTAQNPLVPLQDSLSSLLPKLRASRGHDPGDKALHQTSSVGAFELQAVIR